MIYYLSTKAIAVQILGYPISYVELIGTLFGLASVYLASRANILTWSTGIINEIFLFILFFQVQLYADMFLQIYFFGITVYGWYVWNKKTAAYQISSTSNNSRWLLAISMLVGTIISGFLFAHIHSYLPEYFTIEAAYPFIDSFVLVSSIAATLLLARKKIENWYLWIAVDAVGVALYYRKGIYFLSLEYLIFLGLAVYGLYHWKRQAWYE